MFRGIGLGLLLVACGGATHSAEGGDLSEHRVGFETLCHAEARSGAIEQFPFAAKTQAINDWLAKELQDPYVRTLYREKLPQESLAYQGEMLRRRAAAAGVPSCPMAGLIDFLGQLSTVANGLEDCTRSCVERHGEGSDVADLDGSCSRGCGG